MLRHLERRARAHTRTWQVWRRRLKHARHAPGPRSARRFNGGGRMLLRQLRARPQRIRVLLKQKLRVQRRRRPRRARAVARASGAAHARGVLQQRRRRRRRRRRRGGRRRAAGCCRCGARRGRPRGTPLRARARGRLIATSGHLAAASTPATRRHGPRVTTNGAPGRGCLDADWQPSRSVGSRRLRDTSAARDERGRVLD